METAILVFKASAFIWIGWIYIGYIAKTANSEPLASQLNGKMSWACNVITIVATLFIAFSEVLSNSVEAIRQLAIL